MSWLDRLTNLNLPTQMNNVATVPVYFGGSKFIKQPILDELEHEYDWVNVSHVTFHKLANQTKKNNDRILKYLLQNRTDNKIYKYSNIDFKLLKIVHKHLVDLKFAGVNEFNSSILKMVYDDCCDFLQRPSNEKIVILLDCRRSYFEKYAEHEMELLLHTVAFIALMRKRILYSFIDFIVIIDKDVVFTPICMNNIKMLDKFSMITNGQNNENDVFERHNMHDEQKNKLYTYQNNVYDIKCENIESFVNENEYLQDKAARDKMMPNLNFIRKILFDNLTDDDHILYDYDKKIIKKILINAHKSNIVVDFELI